MGMKVNSSVPRQVSQASTAAPAKSTSSSGSSSTDDTKKQLDKMEVDFMISQFESRCKELKDKEFKPQ